MEVFLLVFLREIFRVIYKIFKNVKDLIIILNVLHGLSNYPKTPT